MECENESEMNDLRYGPCSKLYSICQVRGFVCVIDNNISVRYVVSKLEWTYYGFRRISTVNKDHPSHNYNHDSGDR